MNDQMQLPPELAEILANAAAQAPVAETIYPASQIMVGRRAGDNAPVLTFNVGTHILHFPLAPDALVQLRLQLAKLMESQPDMRADAPDREPDFTVEVSANGGRDDES